MLILIFKSLSINFIRYGDKDVGVTENSPFWGLWMQLNSRVALPSTCDTHGRIPGTSNK